MCTCVHCNISIHSQAIFEVVTTEATYLRSLDVLIDHFMEDPGMNPNLPEGRRVLDKRQHHVIFSNVGEVREISARWATVHDVYNYMYHSHLSNVYMYPYSMFFALAMKLQ